MTEYVAPVSNYLLWEIDADNDKLLCVPLIGSIDEVHSTENGGLDWTKEIDRGNSGFRVGWHDKTNEKIYLMEKPAVGNVTTGFIDYSTWATITWTSHNGDLGVDLAGEGGDIFIRDGNIEAVVSSGAQLDARRYNNPWFSIDVQADAITYIGMGVVIGTVYYFWGDEDAANTINMYKFDGATITPLDTIAATSRPTGIGTLGGYSMAYDGSDIIYFTCKDDGTGDLYLYSYSITGDVITKLGFQNIVLMADRNTATGYKEKGYQITGNDIYQLHESIPYQLHKIAVPAFASGFNSFAMTDNFLYSIDGTPKLEVWKYEDQINNLLSVDIIHEIMEAPLASVTLKKDLIPIENGMVMKFIDNYTSSVPPILYRGTYNFKDEVDGTTDTDITFITSASGTDTGREASIVASNDGHKKVMKLICNGDNGTYARWFSNTLTGESGDIYIELWIKYIDNGVGVHGVRIQNEAPVDIVYLFLNSADNFLKAYYGNGAGGNVTVSTAIPTDTWTHIKINVNTATNKQSLWVNGVILINGENLVVDRTATSLTNLQFRVEAGAGANALEYYIDAIGFDWDTDYDVGDNLRVAGEEKVVFEGVIFYHTDTLGQTIDLRSLAEKDVDARPSGDYSGRSDEIITSLLSDYCSYITKGTFSVGTAMGTITFGGEKKLGTILDELAYFENWIWYLTPTGVLYFNNGTVDILENFTEADNVHFTKPRRPHEVYNKIKVKGSYVDGVQVESEWKEDLELQQKIGINHRTFTFSFLNTIALCNIAANNLLTRLGKVPIIVNFVHQDVTIGFMQPGQTITYEFNRGGIVVSPDQFGINEIIYIEQSVGTYDVSDELL